MAALFMLMGLPASGKTTFAKQMEAERRIVHLAPDVWMDRVVGDGHDGEKRMAVEKLLYELAERLLTLGCDVLMEFGYFRRTQRDVARRRADAAGAEAHLIFLDVPLDELWRRLEKRNRDLPPETFHVSQELLLQFADELERPGPDEPLWSAPATATEGKGGGEAPVSRVGFLGLRTRAFEQTLAILRDGLGATPESLDGASARFRLGDGTPLELYGPDETFHGFFTTGPVAGLEVPDFDAARRSLEAQGVSFIGDEQQDGATAWQHFHLPDGTVMEIIGPTRHGADAPPDRAAALAGDE